MNKKRHHYIPKSYLKFFCDNAGQVRVYRKDDPCKVIQLSPDNTGFHKYYYSQPKPDGGKDHNALEDCFSKIEDKGQGIVDRLHRRENVNDSLVDIFQFMILQRARVPASRDAIERIDAERMLARLVAWMRQGSCRLNQRALKISLAVLKFRSTPTNPSTRWFL